MSSNPAPLPLCADSLTAEIKALLKNVHPEGAPLDLNRPERAELASLGTVDVFYGRMIEGVPISIGSPTPPLRLSICMHKDTSCMQAPSGLLILCLTHADT